VAAAAAFALCSRHDVRRVTRALTQLLPDRSGVAAAVAALAAAARAERSRLVPVARAVLAILSSDPLTIRLRVELAAAALPAEELAGYLDRLAAADVLHADALAVAQVALGPVGERLEPESLDALEAALGASPDERLRRLALAALTAGARAHGWTDDRLRRLRGYRGDPAPLVAEAAQFTLPADEDVSSRAS
jgi:hypothetical protein